jgi:hypothetical protein
MKEIIGNIQNQSSNIKNVLMQDEMGALNFMPQLESLDGLKNDKHLYRIAEAFSKEAQRQLDLRKESGAQNLYKLNAKGLRVENYDSDTAEKIKKFNERHKMSPTNI